MKHKRWILAGAVFFASLNSAFGCDYLYTIMDQAGTERVLREGETALLRANETYTLRMEYRENHRNCSVTPEQTLYLLEGARWRVARESQPLVLVAPPQWEQPASRSHRGDFTFLASQDGYWTLEVIRSCDRGGYHGTIYLEVKP
ncbi:hypothetical protein SAMN05920897_10532 [Alkalispirochaeta americana]|uniref:Lipoprotein n=1 Tax=Alkalispirochaeta americana TaxID=159291 RepID=A0A1N6QSE9_9SPIO|nr:hypothetical protein [Alkalispirochaeta americana]SIQ19468.1 hypothetical protein SAMN05920897_10532 [Alkalispirochaeta americana]